MLVVSQLPSKPIMDVLTCNIGLAGGAMGGKNPMSFGKSKARLITKDESHVTFEDVAGVEEARVPAAPFEEQRCARVHSSPEHPRHHLFHRTLLACATDKDQSAQRDRGKARGWDGVP